MPKVDKYTIYAVSIQGNIGFEFRGNAPDFWHKEDWKDENFPSTRTSSHKDT